MEKQPETNCNDKSSRLDKEKEDWELREKNEDND